MGDDLADVVEAGRRYVSAHERWNPHLCGPGNDASLQGFPRQLGNELIFESVYDLERAVNPECHPRGSDRRCRWRGRPCDRQIRLGFDWLCEVHTRLLDCWKLAWICDLRQSDFETGFRAVEIPSLPGCPDLGGIDFTMGHKEIESIGRALATLESVPDGPDIDAILDSALSRSPMRQGHGGRRSRGKLKPCEVKAWRSHEEAVEQPPDLKGKIFSLIYEWIRDNGSSSYADHDLPDFETWDRHRRNAVRKLGLPPKNQPRAGREAGTVVRPRDAI